MVCEKNLQIRDQGYLHTSMQAGHGKVAVCIVANCEVNEKEGWAALQISGMQSARILKQYYEGRVKDRAMALHLIDLKQAEHDGWLALRAPEYAGAAKCSLMIEQLRYELGESSAAQMGALCATSDAEVQLSAVEFKGDLQLVSKNNRWIRGLPVCCNAACGKPIFWQLALGASKYSGIVRLLHTPSILECS